MPEKTKFYITTAIDYPNSRPHIGTSFEKIGADVQARYRRMQGLPTFFLMGNDENTVKVIKRAEELGVEPKAYVDDMAAQFQEVWRRLELSYDDFIQTSEPRHHRGCQQFIQRVYDAGDIYKKAYKALYCEGCEEFKTPSQLDPKGRCPNHPNQPLRAVEEENYFFALSKYAHPLLKLYEDRPEFIQPDTKRNEITSLVKTGLQDVSISRPGLTWGIDVPFDPSHKIYVWFDALLNYITGVGYGSDEALFRRWWPADVHVIGKDITRFHCALWPAMLWSAGVELPRQVFVHGFVYRKDETGVLQKFSKSLGNVVEPMQLVDQFGADAFRYYFMRECPFGGDGEFSFERFVALYNSDLANNLGNLYSRTLTMCLRYFDGRLQTSPHPPRGEGPHTPPLSPCGEGPHASPLPPGGGGPGWGGDQPTAVFASLDLPTLTARLARHIEAFDFPQALALVWQQFLDTANRYIEQTKPFELAKTDREACRRVLLNLAEALRVAAILVKPFMPTAAARIYAAFNFTVPFDAVSYDQIAARPPQPNELRVTADLDPAGKLPPLFPRIEAKA